MASRSAGSAPVPSSPPDGRGHRWAALAVLCGAVLVLMADATILNVALPSISTDVQPSSVQQLWIVDSYPLVVAGLLVTLSALGDRWGRRRMLMAGFVVFGVASASVLLVDSAAQLILVRVLLGVGGAMIMPATLSMIRILFPDDRERAFALGIWTAMSSAGMAVGPLLGGALLEVFTWHAAFLVNVPVMLVAGVAGRVLLPEWRRPHPGRWDAVGTVLSIGGMVALLYAIKMLGEHGVAHPSGLAATALAVIMLGWFVRRCLSRPDPLLEVRLFRRPAFVAGVIALVSNSLALSATMLLIAQWLQLVRGHGPLAAGAYLVPAAVMMMVFSTFAPKIAGWIGARNVLAGGLGLGGAGFAVLALAPDPLTYTWVATSLVLVGAGTGSLAIASAVIMSGSPRDKAASAAAMDETGFEIGAALGVAILGSVSALVYRGLLSESALASAGVSGSAATAARESLAGANQVAQQTGASGLAHSAQLAFTDSLATVGLVGAGIMVATAAAARRLTPRDLDIADG